MKNIHVLPTDKPSRLYSLNIYSGLRFSKTEISKRDTHTPKNIYITSDEEIGTDEYYFHLKNNEYYNSGKIDEIDKDMKFWRKIILTTDQDLIADGIEQISEDVLLKIVQHINSGKNIESFDRL